MMCVCEQRALGSHAAVNSSVAKVFVLTQSALVTNAAHFLQSEAKLPLLPLPFLLSLDVWAVLNQVRTSQHGGPIESV